MVANFAESALDAAFGPGNGKLVSWTLSIAAQNIPGEQKTAWANKMKESMGNFETMGCAQVASARELMSGMAASDLALLSEDAMRGLIPSAISAMSSSQLAA